MIYEPLGSTLQYGPSYRPTRSRLGLNQGNRRGKDDVSRGSFMFAFHLDFAGGIFERKGRGMPWEKRLGGV
jgi:hypothetical protein